MNIPVEQGVLSRFQDHVPALQIAYGPLYIAGDPDMLLPFFQLGCKVCDIVAVDVCISEVPFHPDTGDEIRHIVEGLEAHGEEIPEMASGRLQIEPGEF